MLVRDALAYIKLIIHWCLHLHHICTGGCSISDIPLILQHFNFAVSMLRKTITLLLDNYIFCSMWERVELHRAADCRQHVWLAHTTFPCHTYSKALHTVLTHLYKMRAQHIYL